MPPVFLNLAEILEIHRDQIERYGGQPGIRDLGLLQSALAMPAAGFGGRYLHEDLLEMAAAYLFHIARNHPFVEGNKRTGAVAALVFLSLNDIEIEAEEEAFVQAVLAVAEGKWGKADVAPPSCATTSDRSQARSSKIRLHEASCGGKFCPQTHLLTASWE